MKAVVPTCRLSNKSVRREVAVVWVACPSSHSLNRYVQQYRITVLPSAELPIVTVMLDGFLGPSLLYPDAHLL
jgi:hypothetical protein